MARTFSYRINERIHAAAAAPPPPQQAPTVTSLQATGVGQTSATLRGTVNPNGANTLAWFEWGTDSALATFTSTAQQSIGNGISALTVTQALSGLSAGTTYYYRIAANNSAGTTRGSIVSFSSAAAGGAPTVFTRPAGGIGEISAILYGDFTNNGAECTCWFEWGTDPTLTTFQSTTKDAKRYEFSDGWTANIPTRHFEKCGTGIHNPAKLVTGQTYYYRMCASNANGTSKGNIVSFTPTAYTVTATARRYSHIRWHAIDHRTGGGPGRYGMDQALFNDEMKWMAAHYDYVGNGPMQSLKQYNNLLKTSPYQTRFWFVPVRDQAAFEASIVAEGGTTEDGYLHYAAGLNVPAYTHGLLGNGNLATGGDGTVFPAHVSDGSKTRANRVHAEQFGIEGYHYVNIGSPYFQSWRTNLINNFMATNASGNAHDTLFLDTHSVNLVNGTIPQTVEYPAGRGVFPNPAPGTYWADHVAFLTAERSRINDGRVTINNAQRFNQTNERLLAEIAGGAFAEYVNHAFRNPQWNAALQYMNDGIRLEYNTTKAHGSANVRAKSQGGCTGGNYPTVWDRTLMWEMVSGITIFDPAQPDLFFVSPSIDSWEHPVYAVWLPAFEYDIGEPLGNRTTYTTGGGPGGGSDPTGQPFTLYTRETENARVFIRGVTGGGQTNYSDATAITRSLPTDHTYRMLNADGSLSAPMTSFDIRHGEALVFIKS